MEDSEAKRGPERETQFVCLFLKKGGEKKKKKNGGGQSTESQEIPCTLNASF